MSALRSRSLAAALAAAFALLAPVGSAQLDVLSWSFQGCASVSGDTLDLEICTAACSASLATAEATLPATGAYTLDLSWFAQNTCCVELRVTKVSGATLSTLYQTGGSDAPSWCAPAAPPCAGGDALAFSALAGDRLLIELRGLVLGCGVSGSQETRVRFSNSSFTAVQPPLVTSVDPTAAFAVGAVSITGTGLGAPGTTVTIDGVPEPIAFSSPTQIVIQPGTRLPGVAALVVTNAFGSTSADLEFLPTFTATGGGLGQSVEARLASDGPGAFLWAVATQPQAPPIPFGPTIWHGLELSPLTAIVLPQGLGTLPASGVQTFSIPIANNPAWEGLELHLQGLVATGTTPPFSFTNRATIVLGTSAPAPPTNLVYPVDPAVYQAGTPIAPNVPAVNGVVTSYAVFPSLPAGLMLNPSTGVVSGTPAAATAQAVYAFVASNASGGTLDQVSIEVLAPGDPNQGGQASEIRLVEMLWGRLVDVYDRDPGTGVRTLQRSDLVVEDGIVSDGIDYALEQDPVTLDERLTILHAAGSAAYAAAFDALDDALPSIATKGFGPSELPPFPLLPRNATLVLRFDDLLDEATVTAANVRVRVGTPPAAPYEARVLPDPNHGGIAIADGQFHTTRVLVDATISPLEALQGPGVPAVNTVGLPPAFSTAVPNVALRLPSQPAPAFGQFDVLRNVAGNPLATVNNGPIDGASATVDVVRAMRSGGDTAVTGDPNEGFLFDQTAPQILGTFPGTLTSVVPAPGGTSVDFVLTIALAVGACAKTPQPGDVVETSGALAQVTQAGSPPAGGAMSNVQARLLPGSGALVAGPAIYHTPFVAATDPAPCYLSFAPAPLSPPAAGVLPSTQVVARFSEPMRASTVEGLDAFFVTRNNPPQGLADFVVGQVLVDATRTELRFTPALPFAHVQGNSELYWAQVEGTATDLAGNPLVSPLGPSQFAISVLAPTEGNGGIVLRFDSADEDGNGFPELRGQYTLDANAGVIRPRPVSRFSLPADRTGTTIGTMIQFPPGVQEPLSPFGAKTMALWRSFDVGLTLNDEATQNLDVERLNWSPASGQALFDSYAEFEIALSHGDRLPDEAVSTATLLPVSPQSGLDQTTFAANVLADPAGPQTVVHPRALGYTVNPVDLFLNANGVPMMPFPLNAGPNPSSYSYYTWRDTAFGTLGGANGIGAPTRIEANLGLVPLAGVDQGPQFLDSRALPLLMDFRCFPAAGALGLNSFDVSLAINSSSLPTFRLFSAGGTNAAGQQVFKDPDLEIAPSGGFSPTSFPPGQPTQPADNIAYIGQIDALVRVSRAHTIWFDSQNANPTYLTPVLVPPLSAQPPGTDVVLAFRGADAVTTTPDGAPQADASDLDPYGDVASSSGTPNDPALKNAGVVFTANDATWKANAAAVSGSRWLQVRITFVNDPLSGQSPTLSSLGLPFLTP